MLTRNQAMSCRREPGPNAARERERDATIEAPSLPRRREDVRAKQQDDQFVGNEGRMSPMRTKPKTEASASGSSPVTARWTGRASHHTPIQRRSPRPHRTVYGGLAIGAHARAQKRSGPANSGSARAPRNAGGMPT